MTARDIIEAALKLAPDERELVVEELSASLHGGFASDELERTWLNEIEQRSGDLETGTAELVDWPDVKKGLSERRARPSR